MKIAIDINDTIRDYTGQFIYCYQKLINPHFSKKIDDITDFDFEKAFDFKSKSDYQNFKYVDAAFELHARADLKDSKLPGILTDWADNVLVNLDVDEDPSVMYVSTFELGATIQSTLSFLAARNARVREYYFPVNSMTIFDRCDILITANPNLIKNCPDGKTVIKINTPYNKDVECEYSFDTLIDAIRDENKTIIKLIENR